MHQVGEGQRRGHWQRRQRSSRASHGGGRGSLLLLQQSDKAKQRLFIVGMGWRTGIEGGGERDSGTIFSFFLFLRLTSMKVFLLLIDVVSVFFNLAQR